MSDTVVHMNSQSTEIFVPQMSPAVATFLPSDQNDLVQDSLRLVEFFLEEEQWRALDVHDFAFIVFPIAKAYEGFLKEYLFQSRLIDKRIYEGRFFRIGRSFNPDLAPHLRDEDWLFDDVAQACDEDTARLLWQTWLDARNHLFHFFPNDRYEVTFPEAVHLITQVLNAMNMALSCQPDLVTAAQSRRAL